MLWKVGAIVMAGWLVAVLLLNKGGMIHTLLLVALASFVIQFVQDHRTKAYERSLKPWRVAEKGARSSTESQKSDQN